MRRRSIALAACLVLATSAALAQSQPGGGQTGGGQTGGGQTGGGQTGGGQTGGGQTGGGQTGGGTPAPAQQPAAPAPILTGGQAAALLRAGHAQVGDLLSTDMRTLVGERLGAGAVASAAAAPGGLPPAAFASLDASSAPLWHAWVSPRATWAERTHPVFGYDGVQSGISLGVDRLVGARAVLGVLGLYETSDFDTAGAGFLEGRLGGAGVYAGASLTDVLVADVSAFWQGGESDVGNAAVRGRFDAERRALAANLTAYLDAGGFQVAPTVGMVWVSDRQGAYRDSLGTAYPALTVETATLRAGAEVSRAFAGASGGTLTPFVAATATWDVSRIESPTQTTPIDDLPEGDVALRAGLRAAPTPALALSLEVDVSGLARPAYSVVTVSGRLGLRF
ncbi:autotransporter outer membrane beta-barrel domain-containing protein [Salinarimonas rosea]|uniref:autotransporter outer membrane beta-barrel domain-containing protein n=1 Tax=Salinarimonas rosea TaxID=552063 RepID=UPI00041FB3E8|nr:autotransporter outer membrane beta-barrel domain-containing protein [Salinarimonas rosea]